MSIRFTCACGKELSAPEGAAGGGGEVFIYY